MKSPVPIPNQKCLACGSDQFVEPFTQSKIIPTSTEPVMMVFVPCSSCGFIHEYVETHLARWKKRQR